MLFFMIYEKISKFNYKIGKTKILNFNELKIFII